MTRRVYISCNFNERELHEVKSLTQFLIQSKYIIEFAPYNTFRDYRLIEEAIERCNIFVAGVGKGYSSSTWLAHEITYAFALRKFRFRLRPRVFAVRLNNWKEPTFIEKIPGQYPVEWLTEANYELLLEDSP